MIQFNRILCLHSVSKEYYDILKFDRLVNGFCKLNINIIPLEKLLKDKPSGRNIALTFDDGYKDNFDDLLPYLLKNNLHATLFIGPELFTENISLEERLKLGLKPLDAGTSADLRNWIQNGMGVGYHTKTHLNYAKLPDLEIKKDLSEGLEKFRNLTGFSTKHFAFPFGNLPKNFSMFKKHAIEYGIEHSYTVNWGDVKDSPDQHLINRVCLGDKDSVLWSTLKTIGLVDNYYYWRKINSDQQPSNFPS
jgi:peptidoglycan/xylan/chitin deacetylase (PgdA/CDA1 family)